MKEKFHAESSLFASIERKVGLLPHCKVFSSRIFVEKFHSKLETSFDTKSEKKLLNIPSPTFLFFSFFYISHKTRCLLLKTSSDESWQKLNEMEAHNEIRKY